MENSLSKAYAEVLLILAYMEQKYIDMIPKKLLELFGEGKDKNYRPNINPNISLAEQNLQRKTLALLAMLNLNYWCKDENEKQEIDFDKKEHCLKEQEKEYNYQKEKINYLKKWKDKKLKQKRNTIKNEKIEKVKGNYIKKY